MRNWRMEDSFFVGSVLLICGLLYWGFWAEAKWDRYAKDHHCQEVSRKEGTYHWQTVFYDGKTPTMVMQYSGDVVSYQCDNGMVTR